MIVTYLSEESERANVLARLGFSYGIGMVVGPILGGYITSYFNEQTSSLLAACGSLLSVILVLLFIPHIPKNQELKKRKASPSNENQSKGFLQNIAVIGKLFFLPGVGILLVVKLVGGIPIGNVLRTSDNLDSLILTNFRTQIFGKFVKLSLHSNSLDFDEHF